MGLNNSGLTDSSGRWQRDEQPVVCWRARPLCMAEQHGDGPEDGVPAAMQQLGRRHVRSAVESFIWPPWCMAINSSPPPPHPGRTARRPSPSWSQANGAAPAITGSCTTGAPDGPRPREVSSAILRPRPSPLRAWPREQGDGRRPSPASHAGRGDGGGYRWTRGPARSTGPCSAWVANGPGRPVASRTSMSRRNLEQADRLKVSKLGVDVERGTLDGRRAACRMAAPAIRSAPPGRPARSQLDLRAQALLRGYRDRDLGAARSSTPRSERANPGRLPSCIPPSSPRCASASPFEPDAPHR